MLMLRRHVTKGKKSELVDIYSSTAIENSPNIAMTRGGILLVAVLCGGDYDSVRFPFLILPGFRITIYSGGT